MDRLTGANVQLDLSSRVLTFTLDFGPEALMGFSVPLGSTREEVAKRLSGAACKVLGWEDPQAIRA